MNKQVNHVLITRTDGIGDVILTLPLAVALKRLLPHVKISFLGKAYTKPVIEACRAVDYFLDWDAVKDNDAAAANLLRANSADVVFLVFPAKDVVRAAHAAKIKMRIATGRRWHTFLKVNHRLWFSRKKEDLHESQYNLRMLGALGLKSEWRLDEIANMYDLHVSPCHAEAAQLFLEADKKVILHPKSHGSALEWPSQSYGELAKLLVDRGYAVAISGTERERTAIGEDFPWELVTDLTGKLSLGELMQAIGAVDAVVAASTGPLHIAAALGINAVGLYSPKRPIYPRRWQPIGPKATFLVAAQHPENGQLPFSAEEVLNHLLR